MAGILACLICLSFCGTINAQYSYTLENNLRTLLYTTNSYQVLSRPAPTVNCNISARPVSLSELDLKSQTMTMTAYLSFIWSDPRLDWSTDATYNPIPYIFSTSTYTWRPTLIIANSEIGVSIIDDDTNMMRVLQEGKIDWMQAMYLITSCEMDVTFYPFDTQVCGIDITSWSYTDMEVDFDFDTPDVDMSFFSENGEWEYVKYKATLATVTRGLTPHTMATVSLTFRRRPAFLVMSIILPVITIAFLSSLIFTLHPESGEKMGFCLTVMLAYAVYLTLVSDHMPTTSTSTSVLNTYNLLIFFLSTASVPITIFVLHCYHKPEEEPVPTWMRSVTNVFMRVMGKQCCRNKKKNGHVKRVVVSPEIGIKDNSLDKEPNGENCDEILNWRESSRVWDKFFFRAYIVFDIVATLILIIVLLAGYFTYYTKHS